jgi:hypothetical protein
MFRYLSRRARRAEEARVIRFLHAIELSARYSVNPDWTLQPVPDEAPQQPATRTDTVQFPRIVLTASTFL